MTDLIHNINIDYDRDKHFNAFALAKLKDNYLLPTERPQDAFARVASEYAHSTEHAQRLYDYMSNQWFVPATPVLANGGAGRGLPISCFLNETDDSLAALASNWNENIWLSSKGGGIGTYWGNVRSIGENVGKVGTTSGIIPFIKVQDSLSLAISQGSQRRGAAAAYLPISHPEIKEFLGMRRPTGGDPDRKCLNMHQGLVIPDAFMLAVKAGEPWHLTSPKDGHVIESVDARELWQEVLTTRLETGEPYLLFIDNVNKRLPEAHHKLGLKVKTSNLCSEITLPTGKDHTGRERTAVCCLSSLNLATYDKWKDDERFIHDIMSFLDNVLDDFIQRAPDEMSKAKYAAIRERSIGLGAMGFHTYLQMNSIPFESAMAGVMNRHIFEHIKGEVDKADVAIAKIKGSCPDAVEAGLERRFTYRMAIAPNASSSILANVSPSIEPFSSNSFVQKTDVGSFNVRNSVLNGVLEKVGKNTDEVWSSITTNHGSVQHLDFLNDETKDVFKTAMELNQAWVVQHAAERTPYIDQAQSLNIFLPANVDKGVLHRVHFDAWEKGIKSMYYLRSRSSLRAETVGTYSEGCLACQG